MRILVNALFILAISCANAFALTHSIGSNNEVVGKVLTISPQANETFSYYARIYNVSPYALKLANPGVVEDYPDEQPHPIIIPGESILPSKRQGIVINLPELRMYYFAGSQVATFPVTTGQVGWKTPIANTSIVRKQKNPSWHVPPSIQAEARASGRSLPSVVPPGPNNPLGQHALYLGMSGYLIHGTNNTTSIGRRDSHGCIRMFPTDVETLFNMASVGTPVSIINEPIKAGWRGNDLYLQVFPLLHEYPLSESDRQAKAQQVISQASGNNAVKINWDAVAQAMHEQSGIPKRIGRY